MGYLEDIQPVRVHEQAEQDVRALAAAQRALARPQQRAAAVRARRALAAVLEGRDGRRQRLRARRVRARALAPARAVSGPLPTRWRLRRRTKAPSSSLLGEAPLSSFSLELCTRGTMTRS